MCIAWYGNKMTSEEILMHMIWNVIYPMDWAFMKYDNFYKHVKGSDCIVMQHVTIEWDRTWQFVNSWIISFTAWELILNADSWGNGWINSFTAWELIWNADSWGNRAEQGESGRFTEQARVEKSRRGDIGSHFLLLSLPPYSQYWDIFEGRPHSAKNTIQTRKQGISFCLSRATALNS